MDVVNQIVALAERLSQGGVVLILLLFCGLLMWACSSMFSYITKLSDKIVAALTESSKTLQANTLMGEQATKQSEQNRIAIDALTKAYIAGRDR